MKFESIFVTIIFSTLLSAGRYKHVYHNARNSNLSFEQNGFMLIKNQQIVDALNTSLNAYEEHITNTFRKLFPQAKKIQVRVVLYRGTGNNSIVSTLHFDYSVQTKEGIAAKAPWDKQFHDLVFDNDILWIIGTWTPIQMKTYICKNSLALLDANTVLKEDIKPTLSTYGHTLQLANGTTLNTKGGKVAGVRHNSNHKWYFYPHMKNDETIIFTHYKSDAMTAVAHGAFQPDDCGEHTEARKSIESRVFITFDNECIENYGICSGVRKQF
eukprot:545441_1